MIDDCPVVPRPNGYKEKAYVDLPEETAFILPFVPVFARQKASEHMP